MGNTWIVREWVMLPSGHYGYRQIYSGQSVFQAIRVALRAKRRGAGLIAVEWR